MDISRVRVDACRLILLCILFFGAPLPHSLAFNLPTHDQMTRSAFHYLKTRPNIYPETKQWTDDLGDKYDLMIELMVRGNLDADYRADLWLDGWFHKPFVGGSTDGAATLFTSMNHYISLLVPGVFWEQHDGYAFRHSAQRGNDKFLSYPSAKVRGELSAALGGNHDNYPVHGINPGPFKMEFKGSERKWRQLYWNASLMHAVFPPANIVAQVSFDKMLETKLATSTYTEDWNLALPYITSFTGGETRYRHYWRGEIRGLPIGFELLGIVMHMAQDLSMPHHTLGTAAYCHAELEGKSVDLSCGENFDDSDYVSGNYGGPNPQCQRLYDPEMVEELIGHWAALNPKNGWDIKTRYIELAKISARWLWGEPNNLDFLGTRLPDGRVYTADRCRDLLKVKAVHEQVKYQYNLAVAATAVTFEYAAHKYAERQRKLKEIPKFRFNFISWWIKKYNPFKRLFDDF